jgi:hypothetical protein
MFSRSKTVKQAPGKESVSDMIDKFADDSSLLVFSDLELDTMIQELQTSSSARTPDEIDQANLSKFDAAARSMQFCSVASEKAVLSVDDVKDQDKITDQISEEMVKIALRSSIVFAFVHGNVTNKKYWMKITHSDKGKSKFVSFPLLNAVGSRSVLVHVHKEQISKFLEKGKKNTLLSVLEKSKIVVKKDKLKYLFPKGHLLASDKAEIDLIRSDLNLIFQEMSKPIEKRKFELKFFV